MRALTAAEQRGMVFEQSGDNMWTSINNAYLIRRASIGGFTVTDGYGRYVATKDTFGAAQRAAKDHLRSI